MDILIKPWPDPALPSLSAGLPPLKLAGVPENLPIASGGTFQDLRMYVCGITPYDATHLGHAATYLTFDLINRYVRASGAEVSFVENITDIDEPLLERATRDSKDWRTLAQDETNLFMEDMAALRIFSPDWYVPATQVMDLVDQAITAMQENGHVYELEGDLYFRVGNFLDDLPISREEATAIFAERGGDPYRAGKEHPLDTVLWIANRNNEPGWDSSHGFGRPGWHIECAVISLRYLLGANFLDGDLSRTFLIDIQGGGTDLIFPHHFMSAIQVKAITGQRFSRGYVHSGMIGLNGEKMSKSKGNLVFVSKLLAAGVDPTVIRYALISDHYASDRMWTDEKLAKASDAVGRIRSALSRSEVAPTTTVINEMLTAISNDLDAPSALKVLDLWVANTESGTTGGSSGEMSRFLDAILGLAF